MARRISGDVKEATLRDRLSDSEIKFYFRDPTTKERKAYQNESVERSRNGIKFGDPFEINLKYGLIILEGIREGDFEVLKDGVYVPVSSDPKSENYMSAWKDFLKDHASDLINAFARLVFDMSASIEDGKN